MATRGRYFKLIRRPDRNEIFNSQPHEIFALRLAARWSVYDFAGVLECDPITVKKWERGIARPTRVFRARLVMAVERWREEYLEALKRVVPGPHRKVPFEVLYRTLNKGIKSKIVFLSPEDLEALNADRKLVRRRKASFKNLEPVDFSVGAPEPAYRSPEPTFREDQPVFVP